MSNRIECYCGAVALRCEGKPVASVYCHCSDCRSAWLAPVADVVAFMPEQTTVERGEEALVQGVITPRMSNYSCGQCGALVYNTDRFGFRTTSGAMFRRANGGSLPEGFAAQIHIYYTERVLDIDDALPKFKDVPTDLGGSGDLWEP